MATHAQIIGTAADIYGHCCYHQLWVFSGTNALTEFGHRHFADRDLKIIEIGCVFCQFGQFRVGGLDSIAEPERGSKPTGRQLGAAKVAKRLRGDAEYRGAIIAWAREDISAF